jgi:signal transduction histidine kinase
MGVLRRNPHKIAYALITAALLLTFASALIGGLRLHHAVLVERQTLRTQSLQNAILERSPAMVSTAYANVASHDPHEGARLRTVWLRYTADPVDGAAPFQRAVGAELRHQSALISRINPSARAALISAAIGAGLLVILLVWLFEMERRAGRIDRDNAERAEELMRVRDEFVAVVSHELRTPLTSIIGYLELLLEDEGGTLTSDQLAYLQVIQRSTSRLVELVGDLLIVAESERGPLALEISDIDVGSLAAHAVESARPAAEARGVELRLDLAAGGTLLGDLTRLSQMLDNLVSNAIKFTPAGGSVIVRAGRTGDHAVFEVVDTGGGISPADRARLFDPFFRSREATVRSVPGTGLGLTITKAIVDAHRGTIDVESGSGGTLFRVRLPAGERVAALSH